jgi:hypothetical protein
MICDPADLVPSLPELQERILREVFRVFASRSRSTSPCRGVRARPQRTRRSGGPCLDASGREPHDLTLRPHDPWMREPRRSSRRGREHARGTRRPCSCDLPPPPASRSLERDGCRARSRSGPQWIVGSPCGGVAARPAPSTVSLRRAAYRPTPPGASDPPRSR